jgi:hypothetical protein
MRTVEENDLTVGSKVCLANKIIATIVKNNYTFHPGGPRYIIYSYEDETGAGVVKCVRRDRGPTERWAPISVTLFKSERCAYEHEATVFNSF